MLRFIFRGPGALARSYSACLVRRRPERLRSKPARCRAPADGGTFRELSEQDQSGSGCSSLRMRSWQRYSVGCHRHITPRLSKTNYSFVVKDKLLLGCQIQITPWLSGWRCFRAGWTLLGLTALTLLKCQLDQCRCELVR
jgi:hypothetical protein